MHVRPGRPDDLASVVALVAAVDRERGEIFDEEAFRSLLERAALLVAAVDGEIVGSLGIHAAGGSSASIGMSVARTWRRRGIGTALIEAAAAWAARRGVDRLMLEVLSDNTPALALYRKTGFAEAGRRDGARGCVVLMSRPVRRVA